MFMQAKILIVEDEAITSLDIQRSLESMGFEVVSTASNGMEAIQKTKELKPDLILMDIMLNDEMDGIEAAAKILTLFDVPIIYMTSYSDDNTFKRAKLTKHYGFITKPFTYDELRASIEIAIYKHKLDKKLKESEARFHSLYENSFDVIILTKLDGSILAANPAAEKVFDMTEEEIIKAGRTGLVAKNEQLKSALEERTKNGRAKAELIYKRKDGSTFIGETTSSLFTDSDGIAKTSMIIRDITERKKAEENFRKEVERESFLLDLYKKASQLADKELYDCALDQAVNLTDSIIGFFHLISDDQKNIILTTWNSKALRNCKTSFKTHYPVEQAGNWTDCIQIRGPIVYNDFKNSPNRKGFPKGHVSIKRFISIPVFDEDKIKFIFGVGNKIEEYDDHDVLQIQSVANELYRIIKQRHWVQALKESRDNLEKRVEERTEELEKAYDALKESETKFRELFNQATDMISLTELNDEGTTKGYIEVNEAASKRLGYSKDELLNITHLDLYLDSSSLFGVTSELFEKGSSIAENIQVAKDGRQIPVEINTTLFKLRGKNIVLSISRDITERKKAENALKENEERLQLALQVAKVGTFEWDIQTGANTWTPELEAMYGLPKGGFSGTQKAWEELVHPDDRNDVMQRVNYALETGKPVDYEWRVIWSDGSIHWLMGRWKLFKDKSGKPMHMTGVNIDVTERKKAEEELKKSERSLAEAQRIGRIGSWEWNIQTDELSWSDEFYSIFGVNPNTFIPTFSLFTNFIHPDDWEYVKSFMDQVVSEGISIDFDARIVLGDGSTRILNTKAEVTDFDENGKPCLIVGISQDITERKQMEEKLQETIHELERSNQELEQFAYVSSHDLQEPLRTIASFTQLLERRYKGKLDPDADEFMDYIVDAAVRMKQQIQDLLEYSRITTAGGEFGQVNVDSILNQAIANLKSAIDKNNAEITYDSLPDVIADGDQLRRVFQNIIGNAIKYRKLDEPPKINISYQIDEQNNEYVFSISDNGIGIEEQYLDRIFKIFQRLHTIEDYKGTGIGLAVVKRVIERHGGRIWAESEPGKGSTFCFTIPIQNEK